MVIEEVKILVVGSKFGEVLLFVKDQLYDKSVCLDIFKVLIVLLFKKFEDMVDNVVKVLKNVVVKIYIVGIRGGSDLLEMSDMVFNVYNIFVFDDGYLDFLVKKLILKLCEGGVVLIRIFFQVFY